MYLTNLDWGINPIYPVDFAYPRDEREIFQITRFSIDDDVTEVLRRYKLQRQQAAAVDREVTLPCAANHTTSAIQESTRGLRDVRGGPESL